MYFGTNNKSSKIAKLFKISTKFEQKNVILMHNILETN